MTVQKEINGIIGQISRIREQANVLLEQELQSIHADGLLPAHGTILYFLFKQKRPVAMKEIVEKVGRVKSTVTGMINTLEHYGYVERFQSSEDRRIMLVQLTAKGHELEQPVADISDKLLAKVYGDMISEDQETLVKLLAQVLGNLQKSTQRK